MGLNKEQLKLYAVSDESWVGQEYSSLEEQIKDALEGGITFLQLREKNLSHNQFVEKAKSIKKLTDAFQVPLIINDDVMVAKECGAQGVHLGQEDMKIEEARSILGPNAIIGISAHNVEEAIAAENAGADYLGVGAVFGTTTKEDAKPLIAGELRRICDAVSIPVVAIGGVKKDNINRLVGTGIAGIAIVSGVFAQKDIKDAARELVVAIDSMLDKSQKLEGILTRLQPVLEQKKGLVLDMDGTLLDSLPMWGSLDSEYMGRYGIIPDSDFHHKVATMTLLEASTYIGEYYKIPRTNQEIFEDFQTMVLDEYKYHLELKPLAYELVANLWAKGFKIVIATANECSLSEPVIARTGLDAYVEGLISCTMVGASKEKPDVYVKACEMMGISPSECVVFEDSLQAMKTTKKAGMTTVAVYDTVVDSYWQEICELTDAQIRLEEV